MSSASSEKFVSPFIDGGNTQVLNTSSNFQLNLSNFNDSLTEDFMPLTDIVSTKPDLDDSLYIEDNTQLPTEQATLPSPESSLQPSKSAEQKGLNSPALEDSLVNDDDQTQLPDILQFSPIQPSSNDNKYFEDSLSMENDAQVPTEQAATLPEQADDQSMLEACIEKKSSCTNPATDSLIDNNDVQSSINTSLQGTQSSSINSRTSLDASKLSPEANSKIPLDGILKDQNKVRPSFGKKKKSFAPPTGSSNQLSSPSKSELARPASTPTSTKTKTVTRKPAFSIPKKSKAKCSKSDKEEHHPSESATIESNTSFTAPQELNPTLSEKKPSPQTSQVSFKEKENFGPDSLAGKSTAKKSKITSKVTKSVEPKKVTAKEERERKRLEREKAKLEREEAKQERERLKEEKRLEQEKKKAEREQKKMENELKKIEKLQAKASEKKTNSKAANSEDKVSFPVVSMSHLKSTFKAKNKFSQNEDEKESSSKAEQPSISYDAKAAKEITEDVEQVAQRVESVFEGSPSPDKDENDSSQHDENALSVQGDNSSENNCEDKAKPSAQGNETHCESKADHSNPEKNEGKKRKRTSCVNIGPDAKKAKKSCKSNKTVGKTTSSLNSTLPTTKSKNSLKKKIPVDTQNKSDPPKPLRSKPTNYSGPVWVQCDSCEKWRRLTSIDNPSSVPDHWTCAMNDDSEHAQCSTPEEVWSDVGDSQEFVESPYIPGSLVWAKMDGYPWWPAMVEEDPNEETYYKLGRGNNFVPVKYHVVFLDTPVCRAWVHSHYTHTFTDSMDPNDENKINVPKKYRRSLKMATKWALKAMGESFKERLERFSFSQRFRRGGKKRKAEEGLDSQDSKCAKSALTITTTGKHKSARLVLTKIQQHSNQPTSLVNDKEAEDQNDTMAMETGSSVLSLSKATATAKGSAYEADTVSTSQLMCMAEE